MDSFGSSPRSSKAARTRPLQDLIDMDDDTSTGKLVMVVDDSRMICRIVEYSLGHYGISTVPFYSGVDALNALNEGTVPVPDLVLLDIGMPHMSGYDVASLLTHRREFRSVPIVMLSGHDGIFDRLRARHAGADEFISKPFDEQDLVRKVFPLLDLELPGNDSGGKN